MEKSLDFDYIFKYILIGDASVGKSTILNMFINNAYVPDNNPTMGVEFATKKLALKDKVIKIQIWDTVLPPPRRPARSPSAPSRAPTTRTPSASSSSTTSTTPSPRPPSTPGSPKSTTTPTSTPR